VLPELPAARDQTEPSEQQGESSSRFLWPGELAHESGSATNGRIWLRTAAQITLQPAFWPDERRIYLNTADWSMLLGKKLFVVP